MSRDSTNESASTVMTMDGLSWLGLAASLLLGFGGYRLCSEVAGAAR